jgi:hypothetical protein
MKAKGEVKVGILNFLPRPPTSQENSKRDLAEQKKMKISKLSSE